jgi:hypothetical protein
MRFLLRSLRLRRRRTPAGQACRFARDWMRLFGPP